MTKAEQALGYFYFAVIIVLVIFAAWGVISKLSTPSTVELEKCVTASSHDCYGTNVAEDGYAQNYVDINGNTYYWEK